jgi:hypothetical protein
MATTEKEITENTSEKKKRRGRPRLMEADWEEYMRETTGQYVSHRTIQNADYETRAVMVLKLSMTNAPDYPYRWLADPTKQHICGRSQRQGYRKTVLAELGRIKNEEDLRDVALEVCRLKPKTQDAIRMIRRSRLGQSPKANPISVEDAIWRAIEDYKSIHPETTENDICNAVCSIDEVLQNRLIDRLITKSAL